MTCQCPACEDYRRWKSALRPRSHTAHAAFDEIMERLEAAETDAVFWRMKFHGQWPTGQLNEQQL